MTMAREFVQEWEAKSPGVAELLNRTGLGNNAMIIAQIVAHAERLAIRNGFKK
jgi:hypothetical protein